MSQEIIDILVREQRIFNESIRKGEPTQYGIPRRRFRWSRFRFEYGRMCWIVHPWGPDVGWWEWLDA